MKRSRHGHLCFFLLSLVIFCSVCFCASGAEEQEKIHIHKFGKYVYNNDASCTKNGTKTAVCECGETSTVKAAGTAAGHSFGKKYTVDKKATFKENGQKSIHCSRCDAVKDKKVIKKLSQVTLEKKKFLCTGKKILPAVTAKDSSGKALKKDVSYTVTYPEKSVGCGKYKVTVRFTGDYSGKRSLYYKIVPGKPAELKSTSSGSDSVKLKWSKVHGADKYQLFRYDVSAGEWKKIATTEKNTCTVKNLSSLKRYLFAVKTVSKTADGTYYSSMKKAKIFTRPQTPSFKAVKPGVKKVKVTWNKVSKADGYQIAYCADPAFPKGKVSYTNVKGKASCEKFILKLSGGKKLYFKIRSYGTTYDKKMYSTYSPVKAVTVTAKPTGSPVTSATSAAVIFDVRNNETVFTKNPNARMLPASMTKLITACTALKYVSPDKVYTVGNEIYLVDPLYSLCGLRTGYRMTLYDLLCGMLMPSGCDAAYCIAAHVGKDVGGSDLSNREAVNYFCSLMNKFAKEIGMNNSHFDSPEGYERRSHYTTAADMAKVVKYALSDSVISSIVCHNVRYRTIKSGETLRFESTNRLLFPDSMYYNPNVIGMKTGTTTNAGYCISVAYDDGMERLIVISMGNDTNYDRYTSANNMINWYAG